MPEQTSGRGHRRRHHAATADDGSQHDHVAAAAYLMKHAGTTALMVVDAQTGQRQASSRRQTLPTRSRTART